MNINSRICMVVMALFLTGYASAETVNSPVTQDATACESTGYRDTVYNTDLARASGASPDRFIFYMQAANLMNDLSGFSASDVLSAKLWVYQTDASVPDDMVLYPAGGSWNEATLTWNNMPGGAGGGYGIPDDFVHAPSYGWNALDVLGEVRAWCNGSLVNHGVILLTWSPGMNLQFNTSENTTADSFSPFGNRAPFFQITVVGPGNVPTFSSNPQTDANNNVWAVYDVDDSNLAGTYKLFSNYNLMTFYSGPTYDYWLGVVNRWTHPSYGQGESPLLSSLWTDVSPKAVYLGAMTFNPAVAGTYRFNGAIQGADWDVYGGYNDTVLTFGKFDSTGKWTEFYSVQVAHNAQFIVSSVAQLQGIPLGVNEKLVLLVRSTGPTGVVGTANLSRLKVERVAISSCSDVIQYGYGLSADISNDCKVDFKDLRILAGDWLK